MNFQNMQKTDKEKFLAFLQKSPLFDNYYASELNFSNLMTWKITDSIEYTILDDVTFVVKGSNRGIVYFFPPISPSPEDFIKAVQLLEEYSGEHNVPFIIKGLTEKMAEIIVNSGLKYRLDEERDYAEYLYSSESLITLSGKKLNKKRNLYNQFVKNNQYTLKSFESSDFDLIKDLLERWESQKSHAFEHAAIYEALTYLQQLDLFCDLLIVDEKAVAFAIGTKTKNMGMVLFEKADTDYVGVYAAINTLFAEKHFHDVEFINRQEDLGIAELRKAKMSYNPIGFVKKYTLTRNHLSMTEVNDLKALYHEAFNDSEGYLNYFFSQKYRADNVIFIKDQNEIVSALHLVKKQLLCHDVLYDLPFVVAAATRESHRKQGLMKKIISQSFKELYNRKITLCALSPFDDTFYRPFGYESVLWSHHETRNFALPGAYNYLKATSEHIELLSSLYQKKLLTKNVMINRKLSDWDGFLKEVESDEGQVIIVYENENPIGYYTLFNETIEECCLPDDALLPNRPEFSSGTLEVLNQTVGTPQLMLRIVDTKRFLEKYPFPVETNLCWKIHIKDAYFEANDVTIELNIENGVTSIRDIEVFDKEMTVNDLAKAVFLEGQYPFIKPSLLIFDRF